MMTGRPASAGAVTTTPGRSGIVDVSIDGMGGQVGFNNVVDFSRKRSTARQNAGGRVL